MKPFKYTLLLFFLTISVYSQKNFIDQPYVETEVEVDALVVPDRIYLTIRLSESDSRNKISTEEKEKQMIKTLEAIGIDVKKDLSLLEFSSEFRKYFLSNKKVLKTKIYSLLVRDGVTASKVLVSLEKANISNVIIEKIEYSKSPELLLQLKSKAILKAKRTADSLAIPLNQKIGKALFISDLKIDRNVRWTGSNVQIRGAASLYGNNAMGDLALDFKQMKFTAKLSVKFALN
jgi:hypothetical protein